MKRVFILNGNATSGKDTFVDMVRKYVKSIHYSYVSNTKEGAKEYFGWDNDKSEKGRKFIADVNRLSEWYNDRPFKDVAQLVHDFLNKDICPCEFMFIDAREIKVIERMKREFHAETIYVSRSNSKCIKSNYADAQTDAEYDYDYYIRNDGDLEGMEKQAKEFINCIIKEETGGAA